MPRNGSGVYSKPAGTTAITGEVIEAATFNTLADDLVSDANAARPVSAGGTGANNVAAARTAFGLGGGDAPEFAAVIAQGATSFRGFRAREASDGASARLFWESNLSTWNAYVFGNQFRLASGGTYGSSNGTTRLTINEDFQFVIGEETPATTTGGSIIFPGRIQTVGTFSSTTANSANLFIGSNGLVQRSTSSGQYKTDVETATDWGALIDALRPITYRSTSPEDDQDRQHVGLIAEEVALADDRFVFPESIGVMYERLVVPLIAEVQNLRRRVAELEAAQ